MKIPVLVEISRSNDTQNIGLFLIIREPQEIRERKSFEEEKKIDLKCQMFVIGWD